MAGNDPPTIFQMSSNNNSNNNLTNNSGVNVRLNRFYNNFKSGSGSIVQYETTTSTQVFTNGN